MSGAEHYDSPFSPPGMSPEVFNVITAPMTAAHTLVSMCIIGAELYLPN